MRRSRQGWFGTSSLTLGLVTWVGSAHADLPSAKVAHERAVTAVQAQDLERAKRGFLMAYIEGPRPILLYNLGVACRDLGQLEEARRYFRRFLAEPTLASGDPTRTTAEQELAKLDAQLPPEPQDTNSSQDPDLACPAAEPPSSAPVQQAPEVDLGKARWRGVALGATAMGVLSVAGGATMYLLGRGESSEVPNTFQDGAWRQRSEDFQVAGVAMMAFGGLLTIGGITTWFTLGDETEVEVGLGRVGITSRF